MGTTVGTGASSLQLLTPPSGTCVCWDSSWRVCAYSYSVYSIKNLIRDCDRQAVRRLAGDKCLVTNPVTNQGSHY